MSLRIVIDGVDIPYKKDTLKLRQDNNAFSTKFTAVHNEYPFLILKEPHILELLRIDRIQTTRKRVVTPCQVVQDNIVFTGRLVLLEVFANTIKSDLVYESALLNIMEENIKDFMPTYNVALPNTVNGDFVPYAEETDFLIAPHFWEEFSQKNAGQIYPNSDYCFPLQKYRGRYDDIEEFPEGLEIVNQTFLDSPTIQSNNYVEVDDDTIEVYNNNLLYPSVFLLAPLKNALKSVGYKLTGSFPSNEIVKRTFMFSKEHQMSRYQGFVKETVVDFQNNLEYVYDDRMDTTVKKFDMIIEETGTFKIKGIIKPNGSTMEDVYFTQRGANLKRYHGGDGDQPFYFYELGRRYHYNESNNSIEGEYTFYTLEKDIGETVTFYLVPTENMRDFETAQLTITKVKTDAVLYTFHPTLDLARFVPDWTVAKMINSLTNWRNVSVRVDDVKKEVVMDYNEALLLTGDMVDLSGFDFRLSPFSPSSVSAFVLKSKNEEDPRIIYNSDGVINSKAQDQYTETIENEFKQVQVEYPYAILSKDYEELDGIGLGVYSADGRPSVIDGAFGETNNLTGTGGIYEKNWKKWLHFRTNASSVQVVGSLSLSQINEIAAKKKVYLNNQTWLVRSTQYQEGRNEYQVVLDLESINF